MSFHGISNLREVTLKMQLSGPCNLEYLKSVVNVPLDKCSSDWTPELVLWSFIGKKDIPNLMEAERCGSENVLAFIDYLACSKDQFLKGYLKRRSFLGMYLMEIYLFSQLSDFNYDKTATVMAVYYNTYKYFETQIWLSPRKLWHYFKELIFTHSLQDSPYCEEIFRPQEAKSILKHFHSVFMVNLPLIHEEVHSAYKLKISWPIPSAGEL